MNLKRQLLLVSLLTLVLPWAGYQVIRETESALRAGQQQMPTQNEDEEEADHGGRCRQQRCSPRQARTSRRCGRRGVGRGAARSTASGCSASQVSRPEAR